MNTWTTDTARPVTAPREVQVSILRPDGTLHRTRTIWIVAEGDRVFIRSTNGRGAGWFRAAIATGRGRIHARGTAYDVLFTEVQDEPTSAPRTPATAPSTGHYASIVDLEEEGPRAATLQVHPA